MKWYALTDAPLKIYGLAVKEGMDFFRLPYDVIDTISPGVSGLARCSAGGRVRFRTDAAQIHLRWMVGNLPFAADHMGCMAKSGVDCYVDGIYRGSRAANYNVQPFTCMVPKQKMMQDVDLYLPTYNRLIMLEIGVDDSDCVEAPRPYTIERPIVFYGSSITQGASASRPGVNYVARAARALNADFINLGFAGNARGEANMAEYIASLDMSLFVLDYDHNAPSVEHLQETHYPFYEIIRKAQPDLPILMLSKPDFDGRYTEVAFEENTKRRAVIMETLRRAQENGDQNIRFIDGETFFGDSDRDNCTVDGCHPTDLGFFRMAEKVIPVLKEMLE
ncbi:MAG: hypothetical protein IJP04_01985 [Clostridia bacterium]|nr:hypothetical protein [Clostridia bacterium]